jgi:hypothetical protein
MLEYEYEIIYKKGKKNVVENALSWNCEEERSLFSLSFIMEDWLNDVSKEWLTYPNITSPIEQFQMESHVCQGYTWPK